MAKALIKVMIRFFISTLKNLKETIKFSKDYYTLKSQSINNKRFKLNRSSLILCYGDATNNTYFDRHYVYHPAWAARILKDTNPKVHIDISSTLQFCSVVSAFIPIEFYDYRPAEIILSDLSSKKADLTMLHFSDNSIDSLSCMHTIEHIGLGRYGDPVDYEGDLKAMKELSRVLAYKGNLLIVVPVAGESIIHFNAHRVYKKQDIIYYFNNLKLVEFSLIPDDFQDGGIIPNPSDDILNRQKYACGCFWFTKLNDKNN